MEDRKLNEKESLELITQMIQNTRTKMEKNVGTPFLVWGYATVIVAYVIWYLIERTGNYNWNWLWFMITVVGSTQLLVSAKKRVKMPKTYIDKILTYVWRVIGWSCFMVSCLAIIKPLPILFLVLLLLGAGGMITGLITRCNAVTIGGLLGTLSSVGCLWLSGIDQILVFGTTFIFMCIIPGHVLNYKARKGNL